MPAKSFMLTCDDDYDDDDDDVSYFKHSLMSTLWQVWEVTNKAEHLYTDNKPGNTVNMGKKNQKQLSTHHWYITFKTSVAFEATFKSCEKYQILKY